MRRSLIDLIVSFLVQNSETSVGRELFAGFFPLHWNDGNWIGLKMAENQAANIEVQPRNQWGCLL